MTIKDLKEQGLIILECISGSRAYGLETPESDTDIKGVYVLPKRLYYGLNYIPQISNATNDIVYYELGRFIELLSVNNPNILELLYTPESAILYKHSVLEKISPHLVLSKLCEKTFGNFAVSQIKKARGLNKKIGNPMAKERKDLMDFCYVNYKQGSMALRDYLKLKNWLSTSCGLNKLPNMNQMFGLYYNSDAGFNGILRSKESNEVVLSQIPKDEKQVGILYVNQAGYSKYCKMYAEYWKWVENRNETRYLSTINHGKSYDAKNMMHTIRLLTMAIEIAKEKRVVVKRQDRAFLLHIKGGGLEFDALLDLVDGLKNTMYVEYQKSSLPDKANIDVLNQLVVEIRETLYLDKKFQ